jgi:hypothetical protein
VQGAPLVKPNPQFDEWPSLVRGMLAIKELKPEPTAAVVTGPPPGTSLVQMWRTIPYRAKRKKAFQQKAATDPKPLEGGEFTVAAGLARAITKANKLIWMFDQYFWSQPLARLLNFHLTVSKSVAAQSNKPETALRMILVLPPLADVGQTTKPADVGRVQHRARLLALQTLTSGVTDQVRIFNLWDYRTDPPKGRGIYCHAKTHTYDGTLLVCGSANLNRRSLIGDSELACAVADNAVVLNHQRKLWELLFPTTTWPGIDWDDPAAGANFFNTLVDTFDRTNGTSGCFLIKDPWCLDRKLPNGVTRDDSLDATTIAAGTLVTGSQGTGIASAELEFEALYNTGLESESLKHDTLENANADLSQVVERLKGWKRPPPKGQAKAPPP